ncbi:hypothetical protein [Coleofasciculus sp.]|uniref:hypothetical protein n=1 Tax=Coleofasciculus sp. TaxID=3100458 RepID=UPI003A246F1C
MSREQIGVSLTPEERELVEQIAKRLNLPLARVVREAAMEGIDIWIDRINKREEFLKRVKTTDETDCD